MSPQRSRSDQREQHVIYQSQYRQKQPQHPRLQQRRLDKLEKLNRSEATEFFYIYIFIQKTKNKKLNASSINPFFHYIYMQTTTGSKTFNNAIIGLDDEEKYDGIQESITKHLQSGKDQGAKYGWSNNVALIETTPGVHLLV